MGMFRLLLALSVVIFHTSPILSLTLIGGETPVKIFFIISGFYMALILNEKYNVYKGEYLLFISNRFLRIYPAYLAIFFLSVIFSYLSYSNTKDAVFFTPYIEYADKLNEKTLSYLKLTNFFIFGQELTMFMKVDDTGNMQFTDNVKASDIRLHRFLFIPQAWSISLELLFYLISPLLVKRSNIFLITTLIMSFLLRFYLYSLGYNYDPWTFRFFPLEIFFFILGILSYRIYNKYNHKFNTGYSRLTLYLLIFSIFIYQFIPGLLIKTWLLYLVVFLSIPIVFNYSKLNSKDRFIGELSYLVYISHLTIVVLLDKSIKVPSHLDGFSVSLSSILVSIILFKFIVKPIDKIRQKRVKR